MKHYEEHIHLGNGALKTVTKPVTKGICEHIRVLVNSKIGKKMV